MSGSFKEVFFDAPDGLKLYARVYYPTTENENLPLICLPGLTRNSRDFHELALTLANHPDTPRKVVTFDYRGRGLSAYDPEWKNYNIRVEAGDVLAGLKALDINHAVFVGTSRGGFIIHVLAAIAPQILSGVIFNDIGPEIASEGFRQINEYLSKAKPPADWRQAAALQKTVHGKAFPALIDADWDRFAHAIYREDEGVIRSDYDPNLLKTLEGIDFSVKLPDLWAQFELLKDLPLLVIRGENTTLLAQETVDEMTRRHPALQFINVRGQGHAPFLETGQLPELIAAFAAGVDLRGN
ncbi:alpha/beta hydrolase [Phyllobacterium sp. SB3]|uniref:alpha/beta fold hydrolase n=1 Tax=Phyllobacterium sp. SB3 TaxID=3156073 RepID=UPI0032AE97C3